MSIFTTISLSLQKQLHQTKLTYDLELILHGKANVQNFMILNEKNQYPINHEKIGIISK
jgi:hypothetical protein